MLMFAAYDNTTTSYNKERKKRLRNRLMTFNSSDDDNVNGEWREISIIIL